MDTILKDLRYGVRGLLKRPSISIIAILTLAIGIGANSAIFSVVNALLLKPLPFPELDRVVAIWEKLPSRGVERNEAAIANYLDWRSQNTTFDQVGLATWWNANLTASDTPERVQGYLVSANYLDVVGVKPILGRAFTPDEDQVGKPPVVIINYGLWQRRFGSDPNVVGKTVITNGVARTVIGVMPQDFKYPRGGEVLAPLTMTPERLKSRGNHGYLAIGRMKKGVSVAAAEADLNTIAARLASQYPETNTGRGVVVYPIIQDTTRLYNAAIWTMMAAVGFVLLIVCANVANLMLARAAARQKEMALRAALGAGRWRLVRQLLTESVLLALIGGTLGILFAMWGVEVFRSVDPGEASKFVPGWANLKVSLPTLGFNLGLSLLSGVLFGLAPAWQISRSDLNSALKEGGRQGSSGSHRLRGLLVVSEVALSLMLLVSAGLMMRTFVVLMKTNPGFNTSNLLTANLTIPSAKYKEDAQRVTFYKDLVQRVAALPGVEMSAVINHLPLGDSNSSNSFLVEGIPEPPPGQEFEGRYRVCTPDYFRAMGITVLKGRGFDDRDVATSTPVIIINEKLAQKFWPDGDPIGKRIRYTGPLAENPWIEIVGVVQNVKQQLNLPITEDYYVPHAQDPWSSMVLVARTKVEPMAMAGEIRQQVQSLDKDLPVYDVRSMDDVRAISVTLYSFSSVMIGMFAGVALLLAAIGIYGVMSYAVSQRTQEIGIRMALGAKTGDVLRLVVRNGMSLALLGVVAGLAGAYGLTRLLASLLFGVTPTDVTTFSVVTGGLLLVALLACYIPARRATKVNPLVALRHE